MPASTSSFGTTKKCGTGSLRRWATAPCFDRSVKAWMPLSRRSAPTRWPQETSRPAAAARPLRRRRAERRLRRPGAPGPERSRRGCRAGPGAECAAISEGRDVQAAKPGKLLLGAAWSSSGRAVAASGPSSSASSTLPSVAWLVVAARRAESAPDNPVRLSAQTPADSRHLRS